MDAERLLSRLPDIRGSYTPMASLAGLTWLRVGGPAEVLFSPADADDLAAFLAGTPEDVPITPVGVGSNVIVRDGGVKGVVVRLGRSFMTIEAEGREIQAGAAALDARVAQAAAQAGVAGLEFLRAEPQGSSAGTDDVQEGQEAGDAALAAAEDPAPGSLETQRAPSP